MKKIIFVLLILIVAAAILILSKFNFGRSPVNNNPPTIIQPVHENNENANQEQISSENKNPKAFQPPLDRAKERVTKKPFGIFITPQNSPVQPERFYGYHTGSDFEIFPDELDKDVPIQAVCSGKLLVKRIASGYGGVVVQSCKIENEPVTVVYGHLKLASIAFDIGDTIDVGKALGILGADKSAETDGERKHLHLGFHKGEAINIKGYVNTQPELSGWIDPCIYVCY